MLPLFSWPNPRMPLSLTDKASTASLSNSANTPLVIVARAQHLQPAKLTSLVRKHGRTECYAPYSRPYLSGAWQLLCTASPVAVSSQGHHGCLLRWLFRLCSH